MWGCDYFPFSGGWWGGLFPGGLFSILVWGLIILLVVSLLARLFKSQATSTPWSSQDRVDSQTILKSRFARGEISREEFIKMKEILTN
jgi:putative membrane protein